MIDELAQSGMPFALFKASMESVSVLAEDAACSSCMQRRRHLFGLNQNDYLINPCQNCGELVGLRLGWPDEKPEPSSCPRCANVSVWPNVLSRTSAVICYECLRSGRAAIAHETELGFVEYAHALRGLTECCRPEIARRMGLETAVLETFADGSQPFGVRLAKGPLVEMLRTPRYMGLQREYWPYHCQGFMAYLGRWRQEDFEKQSPGSGREWFGKHISPDEPWEDMWEWLEDEIGWSYVHRCLVCGQQRVFVDSD